MVSRTAPRFPGTALAALLLALVLLSDVPPAAAQTGGEEPRFDHTTTIDEMFSMARDAFGMKRYSLSQRCYEEILLRDRANLQAMLELSSVYERTGRLEYARGLLIRATRIDPNYQGIERRRESVDRLLFAVLTAEADSMLAQGDYEQAMPKLSLLLSIRPEDAAVHYKRALCLCEMGRYDAALTDAEAAITIDAQEPYFVLRDRIIGESRRDEVKHLVSRAETLAKSDNPRNHEQALDLIAQILEIDPDHTWARKEIQRLNQEESEPEPAAEFVEPARETGPSALRQAAESTTIAVATLARFVARHLRPILLFLGVVIVFRSRLTGALARRLAPTPLLAGQLSRFPLPEVLLMINAEPHTGVLDIRSPHCRGKVYFKSGEPCHCASGELEGTEALTSLINNARKGRFAFRGTAKPTSRLTIESPLSLLLVERVRRGSDAPAHAGASAEKKSRMKELLDSRR